MSTTKPMPPATLAALQASIAHWERAAASDWKSEPIGCKKCDLCRLFRYHRWPIEPCTGCPIYMANPDNQYCSETPYGDAEEAIDKDDTVAFRAAAQREVEFLRGLLPPRG